MNLTIKTLFKFSLLSVFLLAFCEFFIYYVVISQCRWPKLRDIKLEDEKNVKAMFIADTHLLGIFRGHWFDKLRREWQMYRSFQNAVKILKPDVIFVLGDLFDEGNWGNDKTFQMYVDRFHSLFEVPEGIKLVVVPGNHDMGFHDYISPPLLHRFNMAFDTELVEFLNFKGNHFILINSMAMERDKCYICHQAEVQLSIIADHLNCAKGAPKKCKGKPNAIEYSRPIILQHFPMYRKSDKDCNETDEAPPDLKNIQFKEKWDCLSKEASEMIFNKLNPRLIVTGHIHHGCHLIHRKDIHEYTIPSFSWRNKNNPTFMLAAINPNDFSTRKCHMPQESTVLLVYELGIILTALWFLFHYEIKKKLERFTIYIYN